MSSDEITITPEELAKMPPREKARQHAQDVIKTENNPKYLRLGYCSVNTYSGASESREATYPAEEGEFTYDFLLGGGSLGYPLRPTKIGRAVYRVAEIVNAKVSFLDFTFARFNKRITPEAIEEAFYPVWEESDRMIALEKESKDKKN